MTGAPTPTPNQPLTASDCREVYEADLLAKMRRAGFSTWTNLGRMPDGTYRRTDLEADYQTFKADRNKNRLASPAPAAAASDPCRDEHQADCDCPVPVQRDTPVPSFLKRMAGEPAPAAAAAGGEVEPDLIVRGLRLMAEHFAIQNPTQRAFNVRGWPNMAATTSEAFSKVATAAAAALSAPPKPISGGE